MKKKLSIPICMVLLVILSTSFSASIPVVRAYDYDYGCASNLYTTNWLQYEDNAYWTSLALSQIEDLFAQQKVYHWMPGYGWVLLGNIYGEVINWGSSTTSSIVLDRIDHDISEHYYFFTALYIGHGTAQGFYGHSDDPENPTNYPDLISYDDIEDHTQASPDHRFAFMWVCSGGDNCPQGSPSAWNPLYWSDQSTYGPYVWIGFDRASPWLMEHMNANNIYKYWLVFFYHYALHFNGYSVSQALDHASQETGFLNYEMSILNDLIWTWWPYSPQGPKYFNGTMHVAGDLSMCLPHTIGIGAP
jgi:hypothetical protein